MAVQNIHIEIACGRDYEWCNRFPPFAAIFRHAFGVETVLTSVPNRIGSRGPGDLSLRRYQTVFATTFVLAPLNRWRAKNRKKPEPTSAATPDGSGAEPGAPCSGTMSLLARETRARACASLVSLRQRVRGHTLLWTRRDLKTTILPAVRVSTPSAL